MRSRSFFIVAAVLVLLLVAAGGVYAYDSGREHQIAKGISVGGVDVGGLKEAAARARLRSAVLEPLNQPVVARYHGKRYTLTPEQARVLVVDPRRALLDVVPPRHLLAYAGAAPAATDAVRRLRHALDERLPGTAVTSRQLRDRSWWVGP